MPYSYLMADPSGAPAELFRYDKPGARLEAFEDRLELTTGVLLGKRKHMVPRDAVTGISVEGVGGSTLVIQTPGRRYELKVGIGAGEKIRLRLLPFLSQRGGSSVKS
jgi:hypothetical protein